MWSWLVSVLPLFLPLALSAHNQRTLSKFLYRVSSRSSVYFPSLVLSPVWPGWCLTPRPRRRRRQRQSEPEWSPSACYQPEPEPGNIISASGPAGRGKGCGETKRIRPRMILLPPWPLIEADLLRVRDDNKETSDPISIVFVSMAEPGLRVGQSERRARLASDSRIIFRHFFVYLEKFSSFPLFCVTASARYQIK